MTKTSRILAHGMKHMGRARIAQKIGIKIRIVPRVSIPLGWIREVHISEGLYGLMNENDLVYVEVSPLFKMSITIKNRFVGIACSY